MVAVSWMYFFLRELADYLAMQVAILRGHPIYKVTSSHVIASTDAHIDDERQVFGNLAQMGKECQMPISSQAPQLVPSHRHGFSLN